MNQIEAALYNALTAASVGASAFNEIAPMETADPRLVFRFVTSSADDTAGRKADEFLYDVLVISDSQGGVVGAQAAASIAGKVRDALTGPEALNATGSMATYTCTDLQRETYIKYLDGLQYWHCGWRYRIRVSK